MKRGGSRRISPSCRSCCGANQAMSVATKALESEGARAYTPLVGLGISVWQRSRVRYPDNVFAPSYIVRGEGKPSCRAGGFAVCGAAPCFTSELRRSPQSGPNESVPDNPQKSRANMRRVNDVRIVRARDPASDHRQPNQAIQKYSVVRERDAPTWV